MNTQLRCVPLLLLLALVLGAGTVPAAVAGVNGRIGTPNRRVASTEPSPQVLDAPATIRLATVPCEALGQS